MTLRTLGNIHKARRRLRWTIPHHTKDEAKKSSRKAERGSVKVRSLKRSTKGRGGHQRATTTDAASQTDKPDDLWDRLRPKEACPTSRSIDQTRGIDTKACGQSQSAETVNIKRLNAAIKQTEQRPTETMQARPHKIQRVLAAPENEHTSNDDTPLEP
jgi:hypothetical protein